MPDPPVQTLESADAPTMPLTITNRILLLSVLITASSTARAQYQPPPPTVTTAPCKPTKKDPCTPAPSDVRPATAVNPFPFPGENAGEVPDIPNKPESSTPAPRPTSQTPNSFPFPGESETPASAASSSSSSNSSSTSSDAPNAPDAPALKDEGSTGSTRFARKHLAKVEDLDTREAKDLEISRYYASTGNFQAAYLRAKDAVTSIPDDPAAHLALAQTAQHLNKKEEAVTEYKAYLKLAPDGDKVPAARKALALLDRK